MRRNIWYNNKNIRQQLKHLKSLKEGWSMTIVLVYFSKNSKHFIIISSQQPWNAQRSCTIFTSIPKCYGAHPNCVSWRFLESLLNARLWVLNWCASEWGQEDGWMKPKVDNFVDEELNLQSLEKLPWDSKSKSNFKLFQN